MPKVRKVKRRKSYKANLNRKRLRNKLRKLPTIGCKEIKDAWENKKSTRHNLGDMGLSYNANETLKIPSLKREMLLEAKRKTIDHSSESENDNDVKNVPVKGHVAQVLEAEAKAPRERQFRLPNQQVQFVTYLMDKYGDDYKGMARDKKNYYQMTWCQIRAKINTFKSVPEQYAEYLLKKGEIVLDDSETLAETRKRIAEENVAKHCTAKPKKVKTTSSQWLQESIDDPDFDTADKLEDIGDDQVEISKGTRVEPEKKLKLFSDDESDEEHKGKKSKSKKSKNQVENGKTEKIKSSTQLKLTQKTIDKNSEQSKVVEKLPSSDSESDEELEGSDDDNETGFVDLKDMSDDELSDDDILDNGEFVTDSDDQSD